MSDTPLISWFQKDNVTEWTRWDIGVVDQGTTSKDFGFLIWNNRNPNDGSINPDTGEPYGTTDVPNMEDVTITTRDEFGGETGDLVNGQWVQVRNDSLAEGTFTPIGYDAVNSEVVRHPVKTTGTTTYNGESHTPGDANNSSTAGEVCILGRANDGSLENSKGNYVELTMNIRIPGNATSGLVSFLTRLSYKYV